MKFCDWLHDWAATHINVLTIVEFVRIFRAQCSVFYSIQQPCMRTWPYTVVCSIYVLSLFYIYTAYIFIVCLYFFTLSLCITLSFSPKESSLRPWTECTPSTSTFTATAVLKWAWAFSRMSSALPPPTTTPPLTARTRPVTALCWVWTRETRSPFTFGLITRSTWVPTITIPSMVSWFSHCDQMQAILLTGS